MQSGRVTSSTKLSGGRKLKERSCEGSLRGNRKDATPAVHPSGLSSAAHGGSGAGCAGLCEKWKECHGFLTPTPPCFKAEDDKGAAAGTEQLRIRALPLALCRACERNSRLRIDCGLWRDTACQCTTINSMVSWKVANREHLASRMQTCLGPGRARMSMSHQIASRPARADKHGPALVHVAIYFFPDFPCILHTTTCNKNTDHLSTPLTAFR